MKILALEPYYGGSHKAFLDLWVAYSVHNIKILHLPANKWKWRMRHSAVTFATQVNGFFEKDNCFDAVFCSDMLNLAEFKGLASASVDRLPSVLYFHENQLTYPNRVEDSRDLHFGLTNIISAHAANIVVFNSHWHKEEFLNAGRIIARKMPNNYFEEIIDAIAVKSMVVYPGIEVKNADKQATKRSTDYLNILWASRWEHDKCPQLLFSALKILAANGVKFKISVIGEQFSEIPNVFKVAKEEFKDNIEAWGHLKRDEYYRRLADADVFVSTAIHEFFGISVVEAIVSGAVPVLPNRLAYPEVIGVDKFPRNLKYFYDGTAEGLAHKLQVMATRKKDDGVLSLEKKLTDFMKRYEIQRIVNEMDEIFIENLTKCR